MKSWRWIMLFLGAGVIAAAACTTEKTDDDDDGSSTGSTTGATTGTTTGSSTGTTTGGGTPTATNPCEGQVDFQTGETAACDTCIADNCCTQYQQCIQGSTSADCDAVFDCARPGGVCEADCFYVICDSNLGYPLLKDCVDCETTNCCDEIKACEADADCLACITGAGSCDNNTLDEDVDNCDSTNCAEPCGLGSGGGGTGGSGGGA